MATTINQHIGVMDAPCRNGSFAKSPKTILECELLIFGPADLAPIINDGLVLMENGKIIYAGAMGACSQALLDKFTADPLHRLFQTKCCMPGMWDVHAHFLGALPQATPRHERDWKWTFEDRAVKVGRDVPRLQTILHSGFTSLREVGGLGKHLKVLVEEGSVIGPRIYHSNCPIHITGGHCDYIPDVPLQCLATLTNIQDSDSYGGIVTPGVDGPVECIKAVRQNIRTGASCIKLCCSGGVMTQNSGLPTQPQFSPEEILAMTQEATRHDRLVCAHCHSKEGILAALQNGVQCIEHFTLADDEAIELVLEKDAMIVPTRWVIESLVQPSGIDGPLPPGMSELTWNKLRMVYSASREAHAKAIKAGVRIATGCDIFVAEGYGTSAKELEYLVELGMTPISAIEAATVNGVKALGKQAPLSGQLMNGYDADVICLDVNPLEDIKLLQNTDHITMVFKGGTIQKNIMPPSEI